MSAIISRNPQMLLANYIAGYGRQISTSLARLGSGLRVRSPADNAGSYFLAATLERRANTTNYVADELTDNISGLKSGLDALNEIKGKLEEMSDLANRASNSDDAGLRLILASEYNNLKTQIDEIIDSFSFNGENLIKETDGDNNGTFDFTVTIDEETNDTYTYSLFDTRFTESNGLSLGTDATMPGYYYADARNLVSGFGGTGLGDAQEKANATTYYNAINGTRANGGASGLIRIERAISRMSNTITFLEGRQSTLYNKAANYEAARAAAVGVDEASEVTTLTSTQMKQQAAAMFLAQANTSDNNVMQLLYGFNK